MAVETANAVPMMAPGNTETADDAEAALYEVQPKADPSPADYRERSANLWADPKLRELKKDSKRLRQMHAPPGDNVSYESLSSPLTSMEMRSDLRLEGNDNLNDRLKVLTGSSPSLLQQAPDESLSRNADVFKRSMRKHQHKMEWKMTMEGPLKRLMLDVELMQDPAMGQRAHQVRCNQVDKVYTWYSSHGNRKEARRSLPGLPCLRYNPQDPVMPGSLRAPPMRFENPLGVGVGGGSSALPDVQAAARGMGGSASAPTLAM